MNIVLTIGSLIPAPLLILILLALFCLLCALSRERCFFILAAGIPGVFLGLFFYFISILIK